MSQLSADCAFELFREIDNWYGSPALLTVEPALVSDASREFILDGAVRYQQLQRFPRLLAQWRAGKLPHLVYRGEQHSLVSLKRLPRMLVLAQHYDRAYEHTPDIWRKSPADIEAYLGITQSEALLVYSHRHSARKAYVRQLHRHDPVMANRAIVRQLRQLIVTADETGRPIDINQIRNVLFNDQPTSNGRPPDYSNSLHDELSAIHEDSRDDAGT